MESILSLVATFIAIVAILAINHIVYKREKTLLEINEKYKKLFNYSLEDCVELRRLVVSTDKEKQAYKKAINDCIENFNKVYSNTKLSFDEANCAFVIEDIDVNDSLPTEEEITQHDEKDNENQQPIQCVTP